MTQAVLIAPPLDEFRRLALAAVDRAHADRVGRSAAQAYTDALKVAEARGHLDGLPCPILGAEATIRGIALDDLATRVLMASEASMRVELERMHLKEAVRQAGDHRAITMILSQSNIAL